VTLARTDFADDDFLNEAWNDAERRARAEVGRPYGAGIVAALRARVAVARRHGAALVERVTAVATLVVAGVLCVIGLVLAYGLVRFVAELFGISPVTLGVPVIVGIVLVAGHLTDWGRARRRI
jgi:hypothetical protein